MLLFFASLRPSNAARARIALCVFICGLFVSPRIAVAAYDASYADIGALHRALSSGQISCEELVRYYLGRIARLDQTGPAINAIVRLNEEALDTARRMDGAERAAAGRRSVLYCIPFLAKDNMDTAGIPTTAGSMALANSIPQRNAFIIQRLIDAGAILLGKANMSELAASYGRLGYSSIAGLTLNPYNITRDASGSSSGSAAAVAADFATFALGTDTSGSSRAPASVTGLVGVRPSQGLVSRNGIAPSSLSFDTPGVLARSVPDAAAVLNAIAGRDDSDAGTWQQPGSVLPYAHDQAKQSLRGVRMGVVEAFRGGDAEVDAVEAHTLQLLSSKGAVLVRVALPPEFLTLWDSVLNPTSEAEFRPQFERYLRSASTSGTASVPRSLEQLIERSSAGTLNSAHPVNPRLIEALRRANAMRLTDSADYLHTLNSVLPQLRARLRRLMDDNRVAVLIFSTMACQATPRFDRPDPAYQCHTADPYTASYVASVTGFPEVSLPSGTSSARLPVGESLLGRPFDETRLFEIAAAVAHALPALPRPEFR